MSRPVLHATAHSGDSTMDGTDETSTSPHVVPAGGTTRTDINHAGARVGRPGCPLARGER